MKQLVSLSTIPIPRWFWPLLLGLNFLLHAPFFRLPPISIHVWRQCNTMAVARNFYEENMNILRPRVDQRNVTDGVTGMQFPSYEWATAVGYQVLGFHEAWPRVLNWLCYMAGVVAFYGLVRQVSGQPGVAAVGAWCMAWSPELFYHGINALPDVLALTASIAGLYWFTRWRATGQDTLLGLSLLAVMLGGLTKMQYLVVGFPIAVFVLRDALKRHYSVVQLLLLGLYAGLAVGVPLLWYRYAWQLIESSGLTDFGLAVRPAESFATGLTTLGHNLVSEWPELLLGYVPLLLMLIGFWRLVRQAPTRHAWFGPGLLWGVALGSYYLLELNQMKHHTYYMLPLLPLLLLLAAWGAAWWWQRPQARVWLVILLALQPLLSFARIGVDRWVRGAPDVAPELLDPRTRTELEAATPQGVLCVVGPD